MLARLRVVASQVARHARTEVRVEGIRARSSALAYSASASSCFLGAEHAGLLDELRRIAPVCAAAVAAVCEASDVAG